ncbi:MAG: heavy metal-binding domain-containing protein [Moraxella sp.]|nr:heavy metal-binding domain-containing protein [Moraxella sp.]
MDIIKLFLSRLDLLLAVSLVVIGWYFGGRNERRHLKTLAVREADFAHVRLSGERFCQINTARTPRLVTGSVVIAQDRFKLVMADILSLFGKNLTVYESLLERARREAVIRLKAEADRVGCTQVYGLRFELTEIEGGVEILAYGTAV